MGYRILASYICTQKSTNRIKCVSKKIFFFYLQWWIKASVLKYLYWKYFSRFSWVSPCGFREINQPWFSCFLAVSEKSTNQHAAPPLKARSRILKKRWQLIAYVFKVSWKFLISTIYNFTVIFTHEICYFLKITLYFNSFYCLLWF